MTGNKDTGTRNIPTSANDQDTPVNKEESGEDVRDLLGLDEHKDDWPV